MAVMVGTDFFTVEVLTLKGLKTFYLLFFIQMARNITMEATGFLVGKRYLLHDRDSKYGSSFCQLIEAGR